MTKEDFDEIFDTVESKAFSRLDNSARTDIVASISVHLHDNTDAGITIEKIALDDDGNYMFPDVAAKRQSRFIVVSGRNHDTVLPYSEITYIDVDYTRRNKQP